MTRHAERTRIRLESKRGEILRRILTVSILKRTVVVDYRMSRASGIGVYVRNIVRRLIDDHGDEFQIVLIGGEPVVGAHEHRPSDAPIYSVVELLEIPLRIPRTADVFWTPNYNAPLISPGRLVVTIHDTCHLALPQLFGNRLKALYARAMFDNVRRRAAHVICSSQFTASEVERLVRIDRSRLSVIHCGINEWWSAPVPEGRPLPDPYILFVGNVKPHKNLGRLLEAFRLLQERIPHVLVMAGNREGLRTPDRSVQSLADSLEGRARFTGLVSDELLRAYYHHADLVVFPSLYEGFGFPPLEAMATGTPVAASRAASIPEICGTAAEYFDPYSPSDMALHIERALTDGPLRERLRAQGREQIMRYSWQRATSQVADVFRRVCNG
jgi:glycosyltransferase involved in cell wall biosynthesis